MGHLTAKVNVELFRERPPSGRAVLGSRPNRPQSSLALVLVDVQSGRRRIGRELVGVRGVIWSEVEVEHEEEGFRRKSEVRREGEQTRLSKSERISESVEQEEWAMGCFGKARYLGGDAGGEVSFGVQIEGEEVKGQVNDGMSVNTRIVFARVLAFPFDWTKWVEVAMVDDIVVVIG